jgi:hypothetical protein
MKGAEHTSLSMPPHGWPAKHRLYQGLFDPWLMMDQRRVRGVASTSPLAALNGPMAKHDGTHVAVVPSASREHNVSLMGLAHDVCLLYVNQVLQFQRAQCTNRIPVAQIGGRHGLVGQGHGHRAAPPECRALVVWVAGTDCVVSMSGRGDRDVCRVRRGGRAVLDLRSPCHLAHGQFRCRGMSNQHRVGEGPNRSILLTEDRLASCGERD